MSLLVVLQGVAGEWNQVSFEALNAGKQIAEACGLPLEAVVLGNGVKAMAQEAVAYPVSRVYSIEHPLLGDYTAEAYTIALEFLIRKCSPRVVVFPHTYQVRDYAPKLAARFQSALVSDVIGLKFEGSAVLFVRQLFLGKLHADVRAHCATTFVSVQTGAFPALLPEHPDTTQSGVTPVSATMEEVTVQIEPAQIFSRPEPPMRGVQSFTGLRQSSVIVSVGRGIKGKDDLARAESLAEALGGALAGSRPICDEGLLPMDRLVGSSGQTVSPNLYVAIGISGAVQHLLGMKGSKTVVAINKDETAPIFAGAQYGIVGDLREVIPALLDELRKAKS